MLVVKYQRKEKIYGLMTLFYNLEAEEDHLS